MRCRSRRLEPFGLAIPAVKQAGDRCRGRIPTPRRRGSFFASPEIKSRACENSCAATSDIRKEEVQRYRLGSLYPGRANDSVKYCTNRAGCRLPQAINSVSAEQPAAAPACHQPSNGRTKLLPLPSNLVDGAANRQPGGMLLFSRKTKYLLRGLVRHALECEGAGNRLAVASYVQNFFISGLRPGFYVSET